MDSPSLETLKSQLDNTIFLQKTHCNSNKNQYKEVLRPGLP